MNFFLSENNKRENVKKNAGSKARDDVEAVLANLGFISLPFCEEMADRESGRGISKIGIHFSLYRKFCKATNGLKQGDILFIQLPLINHSFLLGKQFSKLKERGIDIVVLIHDLDMLRINQETTSFGKMRIQLEEKGVLAQATCIVAHNDNMKKCLVNMGYPNDRIIVLGIFDYLLSGEVPDKVNDPSVIIAGNLKRLKSGYIYSLPNTVPFNLYGVNYEGTNNSNTNYCGSYLPDELPLKLEGKYGLVWDGESIETCKGVYGDYLRINNPHKTSLYLAAGIPVIIWEEAALANFIMQNGCGITISSINDIPDIISKMSDEEYTELKGKTLRMSGKLREGYHTTKAVTESMTIIERLKKRGS